MWDYSEEVIDHYRNPRNVGEIEDADLIGEAGSLACGDSLKLYMKVDENGIVTDAKFQTFGCGSAVASSSILTEMIIGQPLSEVKKITNKDIADRLGGLPPQKMHCSVMGHEALENALQKYYNEEITIKPHEKIICDCFSVTDKKLIEGIKENNLKDIEEVANYLKAGAGCGRCHGAIQKILDDVWDREQKIEISNMSQTQKVLQINKIIEKHILPELQKDGGGIELIDVDGNKILVSLKGTCKACKNAKNTLTNFVQKSLREYLNEEIEVVEV